MAAFTKYMNQQATYWPPGVPDGFGSLDMSGVTPSLIQCRWEERAMKFRDAQAREQVSDAVVYTDQAVLRGGWLALGDVADTANSHPRDLGGKEIRQIQQSPNIRGTTTLNKAVL